jgi:hypothetical protein
LGFSLEKRSDYTNLGMLSHQQKVLLNSLKPHCDAMTDKTVRAAPERMRLATSAGDNSLFFCYIAGSGGSGGLSLYLAKLSRFGGV